jgi:hypothetical protein
VRALRAPFAPVDRNHRMSVLVTCDSVRVDVVHVVMNDPESADALGSGIIATEFAGSSGQRRGRRRGPRGPASPHIVTVVDVSL